MDSDTEITVRVLKILAIPTVLISLIILLIPLGIFNAWALQKMYIWFLLPLGLPKINIWHIWGLYSLAMYFKTTRKSEEKWYVQMIASIFGTLLMLALGFVLKSHI